MKEIGGKLNAEGLRVAVVASRFNDFLTKQLVSGAQDTGGAWGFIFGFGRQETFQQQSVAYVWPVRSGSVVPIPPAFWLFGSGLLGLIGLARRRS